TSQDPQQHQLQPRHAGPAPCSLVLLQAGGGLRQSLQTALELDGHHVTALDGGPQGLELLLALRPDAVLVDTELPGLDGLQLALHARAGGYAGRMVALSGAGNPPAGQREALMKAGFDACLARPVDAQQCRAALQGRSSC
ncbi:MAG: response regulator, partial [Giesbergeria sp.]|nr:response regulator [Giesbergeria sp.]